ncbi:hypothetical protein ACT4UT_38215, partial [Bacillus sp. B-TM1]
MRWPYLVLVTYRGATKVMKQSVSAEQIELKSSLPGSKKVYVDGRDMASVCQNKKSQVHKKI